MSLSISTLMSRTIDLGKYESAKFELRIEGVTPDTTEAEIDALLEGPGALVYTKLRKHIAAKVEEAKATHWEKTVSAQAG